MTRELIIEGQHVDLAPDTDITLEYVSNLIGDVGKINLSHSYTAKLPRTTRNARILDDPGRPGHESSRTRRFLSAQYYRNGINLIGQAQAYILRTTPDSYEVALVWSTLEALQTLSQNAATLNDLPGLPLLTWIGPNGRTPDYTGSSAGSSQDGAFFAWYESGLGASKYPTVKTGTHPCMRLTSLIEKIMEESNVPYTLSNAARGRLNGMVLLCAPGHRPSRLQEAESGDVAGKVALTAATINGKPGTLLNITDYTYGWDAPKGLTGENTTHRVLVNLQTTGSVDLSNCRFYIMGYKTGSGAYENVIEDSAELYEAYFKPNDAGWFMYFDEEIKLSGWPKYSIFMDYEGVASTTFVRYNPELPLYAANRVHDTVDIENDNRFPVQGNLPDFKQWDFVKACMAMYGLAPIIQNGALHLYTYDELLESRNAYDWTSKVDMTDHAPESMSYTLDSWAQRNLVTFREDIALDYDPDAVLNVDDNTLAETRNLYELPWAASMQSNAQHYKVKDDGTVEDVNIEPRIFYAGLGMKGGAQLYFTDDMYGEGLARASFTALQDVVRKPIKLTANIRLHEIDLAQLDLTRPVYLGQYGQYYAILKIQTSETDLCKVELLQLP